MELPLDHFRLIGVSPSATSEEILRAFQLRLDKTPNEGFTYEVLTQRLFVDLAARIYITRLHPRGKGGPQFFLCGRRLTNLT